jgi:GNAT superfamily N-acetyltransferase
MRTTQHHLRVPGIKVAIEEDGKEIARARLYILENDLHEQPFGFLEDVFVDEAYRGRGLGKKINREIIRLAKERGCYKIVATSRFDRPEVHAMYLKLGYEKRGFEFRLDLPKKRKKRKP